MLPDNPRVHECKNDLARENTDMEYRDKHRQGDKRGDLRRIGCITECLKEYKQYINESEGEQIVLKAGSGLRDVYTLSPNLWLMKLLISATSAKVVPCSDVLMPEIV